MSPLLEKGRSHSRRKFVFHGHQKCPSKQWRAQEGFTYSDGWLWVVRHVCIDAFVRKCRRIVCAAGIRVVRITSAGNCAHRASIQQY